VPFLWRVCAATCREADRLYLCAAATRHRRKRATPRSGVGGERGAWMPQASRRRLRSEARTMRASVAAGCCLRGCCCFLSKALQLARVDSTAGCQRPTSKRFSRAWTLSTRLDVVGASHRRAGRRTAKNLQAALQHASRWIDACRRGVCRTAWRRLPSGSDARPRHAELAKIVIIFFHAGTARRITTFRVGTARRIKSFHVATHRERPGDFCHVNLVA